VKIHVVQKGETLWEIAQKFNVDFEGLKQANPQLSSPDMIMPGMKVKVPSTTKIVKKETKVKPKEKQELIPQKPVKIEEDEKEKKVEVKPEMPLPQMPEQPQMIAPPTLQMPKMEQEMNHYTMINLPQMPPTYKMKEEKVKEGKFKEKTKEPVKMKEEKEIIDTKYQMPPSLPEHLHTAVKPEVEIPSKQQEQQFMPQPMPFTHMHPVCCHFLPPPCSCMSQHMVGHMQENFPVPLQPVMPWNPNMQMPHHSNPLYTGDCGCNSEASDFANFNNDNHFPMYPQYNMNDDQQPMHNYSFNHQGDSMGGQMMYGDESLKEHHSNQQVGYHVPNPYENMNFEEPIASYPPIPPQNTANFYPTPPSFRDEEEE